MQTMTNSTSATTTRTGCSDAPQGTERVHTLVVLVADRPGSVDRVVGVLRRRRAHIQSFNLSQSETPDVVRITALVKDTKVGVEHLFEQVRKIVDVREASHTPAEEAIMREMALVKVNIISTVANAIPSILDVAQVYRARVVSTTPEQVTIELMGTEEMVTDFIESVSKFGICDVARSGCLSLQYS